MGLESLFENPHDKYRKNREQDLRARKKTNAYLNYCGPYPEKDRINHEKGFDIAYELDREPKIDCSFLIQGKPGWKVKNNALERFKNLICILQKVYKIKDNEPQLKGYMKQISNSPKFSPEELDLYLPVIIMFSKYRNYNQLFNHVGLGLAKLFTGGDVSEKIREFRQRDDKMMYGLARRVVTYMLEYSGGLRKTDDNPSRGAFPRRLTTLSRELSENDYLASISGTSMLFKLKVPDPATLLVARLNYSPEKVMVNDVDCCITGLDGVNRAASMLYWLDPSVFTWEFYACAHEPARNFPTRNPFGLGIFVKARGRHFSEKNEQDYLVFEGFPANQDHYGRIEHLEEIEDVAVLSGYKDDELFKFPRFALKSLGQSASIPELVYALGLLTARLSGIPKLFINVGHSNQTQKSVRDSVKEMIYLSKNDDSWNDENGLLRDPLTKSPFAKLEVGNKKFQYTHFLQKPALDSSLVEKIRNDSNWNGECFFDTWYWWNRFIGNTYPSWSEALRSEHPYAKASWERAKVRREQNLHPESYWNAGIGYCKGFEVDVEKECKRLGIS